jgi:hypothetical protein
MMNCLTLHACSNGTTTLLSFNHCPEFDTEGERREHGIPLHTTQYEAIVATARRVGAPVLI